MIIFSDFKYKYINSMNRCCLPSSHHSRMIVKITNVKDPKHPHLVCIQNMLCQNRDREVVDCDVWHVSVHVVISTWSINYIIKWPTMLYVGNKASWSTCAWVYTTQTFCHISKCDTDVFMLCFRPTISVVTQLTEACMSTRTADFTLRYLL